MKRTVYFGIGLGLLNLIGLVYELSVCLSNANTNWGLISIGITAGLVFGVFLWLFDGWFEHHSGGRLLYLVLLFATWSTIGVLSYFYSGPAGRLFFSAYAIACVVGGAVRLHDRRLGGSG